MLFLSCGGQLQVASNGKCSAGGERRSSERLLMSGTSHPARIPASLDSVTRPTRLCAFRCDREATLCSIISSLFLGDELLEVDRASGTMCGAGNNADAPAGQAVSISRVMHGKVGVPIGRLRIMQGEIDVVAFTRARKEGCVSHAG